MEPELEGVEVVVFLGEEKQLEAQLFQDLEDVLAEEGRVSLADEHFRGGDLPVIEGIQVI